jgi:hypothetical protein
VRDTPRIVAEVAQYAAVTIEYFYRQDVVDQLARHGLRPLPGTPPGVLRDAVRDLYKYEIRLLRDAVLAGRLHKADLAGRVVELRKRYPLLSLPVQQWTTK